MPFDWRATVGPAPAITGTLNIVARKATEVAPESIFFEVDLDSLTNISISGPGGASVPAGSTIYDPRFYQLDYVWNFDDAGTFENTAGRVQPRYQNSNFADTPQAAHCFRSAGTYTVTCIVTDPATGFSGTLSTSVTVGEEDTFYPTLQTMVIDPSATGLAASYPGCQVFTDLDSAITAYKATDEATPLRMILARGETYTASTLTLTTNSNTAPTLYMRAAQGPGADPIIQSGAAMSWADGGSLIAKDLTIQNIRLSGHYNADTRLPKGEIPAIAVNEKPPHLTLDRMSIRNHQTLLRPTSFSALLTNCHVNDCDFEGWYTYGMIGGFARLAICGTRWHQSRNMWRDDPDTADPYGAIRLPKAERLILSGSSFYIGLTRQRLQGGLRLFTSQTTNSWRATISGCELSGGSECVTFGSQAGSPRPVGQALVQNSYLMGTYETQALINYWRAGITVRSNIMNMPEVTQVNRTFDEFFSINTTDTIATENNEPGHIIGNTMMATGFNASLSNVGFGTFSGTVLENNAFIDSADTTDGPITQTPHVTPVELGEILTSGTTARTAGTPTPTDDQYIPTPHVGSGAQTSATGTVVGYNMPYRDFLGNLHSGDFKGAVAPV